MRDFARHESGQLIDLNDPSAEDQALLREILRRATRPRTQHGELRCAAHNAPVYLQMRARQLHACHWQGSGLEPHRVALMSDEHRRQAEYVARAADRSGLATAFEVSLPSVRPDVVIGETTAVEVQRSALTAGRARSRTAKAVAAGMTTSLWVSDRPADKPPAWMHKVPSATAFARSWQTLPPLGSATVTGGVRSIVPVRCRPPARTSCLLRKRQRWCGQWHLTHQPMLGVSLDDLTVGVASGEYVPAELLGHVLLAKRMDVEQYGIGWTPPTPASASTANAQHTNGGERLQCRSDTRSNETCCGAKPPGVAGQPLVLACQLCPASPTYWRNVKRDGGR